MAIMLKATVNYSTFLDDVNDYLENDASEAWRRIFRPLIRLLLLDHGRRLSAEFGLTFNVQMLQARDWLNGYLMEFWKDVVQSTKDTVLGIIDQGIIEGWSIDTMAGRLGDTFNAWTKEKVGKVDWSWYKERTPQYRLEMIARTETIRASNAGSVELYQQWGVRQHEWLSTDDERTRSPDRGDEFDHVGANGEVVNIGTPFMRTGEPMMFPGDPNGSAANSIQCRCTTIPVIEGQDKALKYSDDQPRVPAGNEDGGQWTSEGGEGINSGNAYSKIAAIEHSVIADGNVYKVIDATNLTKDTVVSAVAIRGPNKGVILASDSNMAHSQMVDAYDANDYVDNYVRFSSSGKTKLYTNVFQAAADENSPDFQTTAINNIHKALNILVNHGLPSSTPISYSTSWQGGYVDTTAKLFIARYEIKHE